MSTPKEIKETCFEFVDVDDVACFSTSDFRWIRKVLKLLKDYPDETKLIANNEDGSVTIHCPKSWFRVRPPAKRNYTEEQRNAAADRMRIIAKERVREKADKKENENE